MICLETSGGWVASLMSEARLWRDQGKRDGARELLAPVYGHHDALEFPDGQIVLLTFLSEGQQATGLDRRSGSPEGHIRAGRHRLFDQASACSRDDRARPCGWRAVPLGCGR